MNENSSATKARKVDWWWLPLARRVAGWGFAGAWLWSLPLMTFGVVAALWSGETDEKWVGLLLRTFLTCFFWLVTAGVIAGAVCGFYAPPADRRALNSRFFRRVNGQTFWLTLASLIVAWPSLVVVSYFIGLPDFLFSGVAVVLPAALFVLALWFAVNRARGQTPSHGNET